MSTIPNNISFLFFTSFISCFLKNRRHLMATLCYNSMFFKIILVFILYNFPFNFYTSFLHGITSSSFPQYVSIDPLEVSGKFNVIFLFSTLSLHIYTLYIPFFFLSGHVQLHKPQLCLLFCFAMNIVS